MIGLLRLSLHKTTRPRHVPSVPTNEERYRAFREYQPVVLGNALQWKWKRRADVVPGHDYDEQIQAGFDFKYGE